MQIFKNWSKFELYWLGIFSIVGAFLSYIWGDTFFGFTVFITGIICVVLVSRGSIWNYLYGIYNAAGYSWIAFQNGLFGEVVLNAGYYLPMQFIGYFMWRNRINDGIVEMKKMTSRNFAIMIIVAIVGILSYGYGLSLISTQNTPYIDSTTTVLSVIAMWLMAKRYAEQWTLWIIVNIFSIIMWSYRFGTGIEGSINMIIMWSAYLVNSVYGYYKWNKGAKHV